MNALQTIVSAIRRSSGKKILTLASVALGTGVLILALSVSDIFTELTLGQLNDDGIILTLGNVEENADGEYEPVRPSVFDARIPDLLETEVDGIEAVAPVLPTFTTNYVVGDQSYQIRSVKGTNADYFELFGLEPLAGTFFTAADVIDARSLAVISESLAELVFGSAESAVGQSLRQPATFTFRGQGDGAGTGDPERISMPTYEIIGVYADPPELQRDAYDLGDVILPLYAALPSQIPRNFIDNLLYPIAYLRVTGRSAESVESQIRAIVDREYGDDVSIEIWEGTLRGESEVLKQTRDTLVTFTFVINLLGFILLVSGSIGVFSIMMVDVIGRSRDTALERALGASKRDILLEFLRRSVGLSGMAALAGIGFAMLLSLPVRQLVLPFFTSGSVEQLPAILLTGKSVAIGMAASVIAGGLFGIIPVFTLLRRPISESLREV